MPTFHIRKSGNGKMVRQYGSPQHQALRRFLVAQRRRARVSQTELARRLQWSQQTVSKIETGEKRVTVVELIEIARALDFDPLAVVRRVMGKG